ncbi:3-isopropylmalate dehydratase small subunit [Geodia barretti]|uniref:3-isopropylmalate dehydratase n=1 Tax=Geodia barretti TaxID=519541 RepID=A0AA35X7R2_GEOBA|nr:3-isopropylmalate dehydratase small subunit [Geodia barretti]
MYLKIHDYAELATHAMEGLDPDFHSKVKRFDQQGAPDPGFVLNEPRYRDSQILVTGENFGCGSSREHAVWALLDYGFRAVIAPSFGDIFYSNCFKNGLLPIRLGRDEIDRLGAGTIRIDLESQEITSGSGRIPFTIDPHKKRILLEGLDDIALTLRLEDKISDYERRTRLPSVV